MSDTKAPDSYLSVKIGDEEREIFMSFGLVAELARLVGSIERITNIDLDPDTAMMVLDACLVPRDSRGKPRDPDFQAPSMDNETAAKILSFAGDHVLNFFIRGLRRGLGRIETNQGNLKEVASLLSSSATSLSPTPSS